MKSEMSSGTRPRAIEKGNPGNMPFFSSILKAKKTPINTPAVEPRQ
jgi:hypothetical protein